VRRGSYLAFILMVAFVIAVDRAHSAQHPAGHLLVKVKGGTCSASFCVKWGRCAKTAVYPCCKEWGRGFPHAQNR
jgi:hypothetical protein